MNLKKIALLFFTSIFSLTGIFAESNLESKNDFRKLSAKLSKVSVVRGDFELSQFVKKNNRTINSSGKYTISAKDGMIWFTQKPVQSVMAVTKSYIVQENKGKQRKIDGSKNPTFSQMADVISALFTGNFEEIEKNFDVSCFQIDGNKFSWQINLIAKNKTIASYIKQIVVKIEETSDFCKILQIVMETVNGDSSTYQLQNQVLTDTLNFDETKYFEK